MDLDIVPFILLPPDCITTAFYNADMKINTKSILWMNLFLQRLQNSMQSQQVVRTMWVLDWVPWNWIPRPLWWRAFNQDKLLWSIFAWIFFCFSMAHSHSQLNLEPLHISFSSSLSEGILSFQLVLLMWLPFLADRHCALWINAVLELLGHLSLLLNTSSLSFLHSFFSSEKFFSPHISQSLWCEHSSL